MLHILFLICFILNQFNCHKNDYEMVDSKLNKEYSLTDYDISIKPGKAETRFFEYHKSTKIKFNISDNNSIQINIHAINCNFDLKFNGDMMKKVNLDTYSFIINSTNNIITIRPLLDVIDGQYKENYAKKTCPLSINSYVINNSLSEPELNIKNKEVSYFNLDYNRYNLLKLSYEIKEVSKESYVCFSNSMKKAIFLLIFIMKTKIIIKVKIYLILPLYFSILLFYSMTKIEKVGVICS